MATPKRPRTLTEVDDALAGLARAVERHSRMITTGRGETAALAATVEQLAASLRVAASAWSAASPPAATDDGADVATDAAGAQELSDADDGGAAQAADQAEAAQVLPSWLVTTEWEPGEQLTTELAGWVRAVYLRWPDAVLPACWSLHPWVVEELWVLRCAWWTARAGESASWLRWQDWHDRHRPATARRIAEALAHCGPEQHIPDTGGAYPVVPGADVVPISVTAWATEGHQAWPPTVPRHLLDEPERRRPHNGSRGPSGVPRRTLTRPTQAPPPGPHSTSQTAR